MKKIEKTQDFLDKMDQTQNIQRTFKLKARNV